MKKLVPLIILLLLFRSSVAQISFQILYGDTNHGEARRMIQTIDGNYAFIGSKTAGDSSDIILTKTDTHGNIIFSIRDSTLQNGSAKDDFGYDFKQTADNGYIICGSTFGSPLDQDLEDIILIKTDQNGLMQWANTFSGFGTDRAYSVSFSFDGGYFLTGITNSGVSGFNEGVVVKLDFSGIPVWNKTNSFFNNSYFSDGCSTTDSCFITVGNAIDSLGSKDFFAVKYDSIGNVVWSKRFSSAGNQEANSVEATSDGGCIIAGYNSPDQSIHSSDMLITRLDASGSVLWTKTYNHLFEDNATDIILLSNGNFAVSGFSNITDTVSPVTYADFIEIDSIGDTISTAIYGDPAGSSIAYSVAHAIDSGFIFGGVTYGYGNPNGIAYLVKSDSSGTTFFCQSSLSLTSSTLALTENTGSLDDTIALNYSGFTLNQDLFQVASVYSFYSYCFSLMSAEHSAVSEINVYPNPVQGILNIEFDNSSNEIQTFGVYDVIGQVMTKKKIQQSESAIQLNTENFRPGIYHLELRGVNNFVARKFVKVN